MNTNFTISIKNSDSSTILTASSDDEAYLVYDKPYQEGDSIQIECLDKSSQNKKSCFAILQLDQALQPVFVYCKDVFTFVIPFEEKKFCYPPQSFQGDVHYIHIRQAKIDEISVRKNLALNPCDGHSNLSFYPHASANIETRGESVFAARNAIDGCKANTSHGNWPFASWGINKDPLAQLKIDFGRSVLIDELVFYLRADFPHDAWWKSGTVHFSDGSSFTAEFEKTGKAQNFKISERKIEWLTLDNLIKADDPSPFPALTQIEAWGIEA